MGRAQGAVEYMFMIAAVMVAVLLAIGILHHPTTDRIKSTSGSADFTSMQAEVELIAQKYNDTAWWNTYGDAYRACMEGDKSACEEVLKEYPKG
ncbi:MAG: hypothetical protein J7L37_08905 [Thermococcus sp.]|nr:hypothetical protein [Thermococcus sp.]